MEKNGEYMLAATLSVPFVESFIGDWLKFKTNNTIRIPRRMTELLDLPDLVELLPSEMVSKIATVSR